MTGGAQRVHDVRRSGKTSLNVVATLGDEFRQSLPCQLGCLLIKQAEDDGQRVRRLRVALNGAVIVDVVIMKGRASALGEIGEVLRFMASSRSFAASASMRASR